MFDPLPIYPDKLHKISRAQYDRMVNAGVFEDQKVELLHGAIVAMSPQGTEHAAVIRKLNMLLAPLLSGRASVGVQVPLAASDDSEPEPDFSVVPLGEYETDHPHHAYLVIEVAVSSLPKDRGLKADLYAASGQMEYWLVDVTNRRVVVHRSPSHGRYADLQSFSDGQSVRMLQFPDVDIAVSDILPNKR